MKVVFRYFFKPDPGERGWTRRHTHASHGLRFAVKRGEEALDIFRTRINSAARQDSIPYVADGSDEGWFLGSGGGIPIG